MEGEHEAAITLRSNPAELRASLSERMSQSREILKHLIEVERLQEDESFSCDLTGLSQELSFSIDQTRRALQALHAAGQIAYRPPFRGRGQRILQRIPSESLPIDFAAIARRSEFDSLPRRQPLSQDSCHSNHPTLCFRANGNVANGICARKRRMVGSVS